MEAHTVCTRNYWLMDAHNSRKACSGSCPIPSTLSCLFYTMQYIRGQINNTFNKHLCFYLSILKTLYTHLIGWLMQYSNILEIY